MGVIVLIFHFQAHVKKNFYKEIRISYQSQEIIVSVLTEK